jgi:hypothetical protein
MINRLSQIIQATLPFIASSPFICCVFSSKTSVSYDEWWCAWFSHLTRSHSLQLISRLTAPFQLHRLSYAASNEEKSWSRTMHARRWKDTTVAYFTTLFRIRLDRQLVICRVNLILPNIQVACNGICSCQVATGHLKFIILKFQLRRLEKETPHPFSGNLICRKSCRGPQLLCATCTFRSW